MLIKKRKAELLKQCFETKYDVQPWFNQLDRENQLNMSIDRIADDSGADATAVLLAPPPLFKRRSNSQNNIFCSTPLLEKG